jgi:hypothetical protein
MRMKRRWHLLLLSAAVFCGTAESQSTDFMHPPQKGPFSISGLSYLEFSVGPVPQSGYQARRTPAACMVAGLSRSQR